MSAASAASTGPKTPLVGRPFIARHTATLLDVDLIMLGNVARLVHADLLLFSAARGLDGRVPTNARALNVALQLDGGVVEVEEAVKGLCGIGKLVPADEDGFLYLTDWPKTQVDRSGSVTKSASMSRVKFTQAHEAGKHTETREGCPLCKEGLTSAAPAVTDGPTAPQEPTSDAQGTLDVDVPTKRTMKAALADFREAIPASLEEFATPFEGYAALLGAADEFAELLGDLSKNPRGALRNEVLAHALRNLVNDAISGLGINRANSAAKALGDDGHKWWVHAIVLRAGQPYNDEKHCLNDLTKVAREERSKAMSA